MTMDRLVEEARKLLSLKRKDDAKWILKKKKLITNILEKRNQARHNVLELLHTIENAHSDIEVINSLSIGSSSLKQINKELSALNPEDTMENIAETMSEYKEIQNILDSGMEQVNLIQGIDFNEEDLKRELELLESDHSHVAPSTVGTSQPPISTKTAVVSEKVSPVSTAERVFPFSVDDIPTDSFAILQYERDNSTSSDIIEFCKLKLQLLGLKKKMNKIRPEELAPKLKQKISQLEQKQKDLLQTGTHEQSCNKIATYISLMKNEVEGLIPSGSVAETEPKQPIML